MRKNVKFAVLNIKYHKRFENAAKSITPVQTWQIWRGHTAPHVVLRNL